MIVSTDRLIFEIEERVNENILPKWTYASGIKNNFFQKSSYLRWAADELEHYILERNGDSIDEILCDFHERMEFYYLRSGKKNEAFRMAFLLTEDIIEISLAAGWI